ncbi:MAG: right-handed parallel beta-helix repeat-containing protein [Ignavibacterium sp.]|nr:right-handed parallel beta-helix repeat-containing protein [Ignavibacterium sp.]
MRYVSKTGTSTPPYTSWQTASDSIQKCINICVDGDTVYVANGVYKENLVINKYISLIGSSMDSTVIDGTGLTVITVEYVQHGIGGSFENFTILGKGFNQGAGILTVKNILVKNCRIKNDQVGISVINEGYQIENVIITSVDLGVYGGCASINCNNVLKNCVIVVPNNTSQGVNTGSGNYEISNNIILYTGDANFEPGIYVSAANKINITNNLISNFGNGVSFDTVLDTAFVRNNIITYQSSNGSAAGIWTSGNRIFANNLIFINSKKGIYQSGSGFVRSDYNIFWNNDVNLVGVAYGDSDIVADPMLVKDTIPHINGPYDFHLQAFSPGIDNGDPTILDLDGTRSDIGLYGGPFGETYTYQDLATLAPRNLSAIVDSNYITVRWNRNTEADTSFYKVYRDTVSGFTIDSTKLVSSSADTFFVHPNLHNVTKYVYKITCVDKQGNESLPSSELVVNITGVEDYPQLTTNYLLYQNYPNPFNPNTKIGYQLKERAYVKLMIYDIKGELVSVLINKEQNSGYYEAEFNVNGQTSNVKGNLASGIYLYRIEVIGEGKIPVYTEMKKMLMIK